MSWLRRLTSRSPEDRFADEVAGAVRSLLGAGARVTDRLTLQVTVADGAGLTMNLHTLYAEVQGVDGEERQGRIRTAVLAMAPEPRPRTWQAAAPRLLPAVRAASWGAAVARARPVRRPLAPFVSLLCAIDSEYGMSFATQDDLQAWGVDESETLQRAVDNLVGLPLEVGVDGPTALVLGPDGYASSWLAAPAALTALAARLGGSVVAVATDRDHLMLVDTADHAATVDVLREALERYGAAPRQLSPVPYAVAEDGVRVWTPPPGHPARPVVAEAVRHLAVVEYGQQRTVLEQLFGNAGIDTVVAACTPAQRPDGSLWTYVPWVREVGDGLIPQADVVLLADTGTAAGTAAVRIAVRWEDALRVAGHALEPAGYDPPLWRHHGWPDGPTVAALREAALPLPPPG